MRPILIAAALSLAAAPALAQTSPAAPPPATTPRAAAPAPSPAVPARPEDVASVDAIIAALYDVISGEAGKPRDWNRFRSLYLPGATMGVVGPGPDGQIRARQFTPERYIETSGPFLEREGFFEIELGRRTDRWGPLIRVMSAYDGKKTPDAQESLARGVNLIQLVDDGKRLWISSIIWTEETPENPIPADLLGAR